MKRFVQLFEQIDQTTSTREKTRALVDYFSEAPARDSAWAVYFLTGRKLKRLVGAKDIRTWAKSVAGIPDWLFEECYSHVGDLAETVALLAQSSAKVLEDPLKATILPEASPELTLAEWVEDRLLPLRGLKGPEQGRQVLGWWASVDTPTRFLLTKLLTGGFRAGVANGVVEVAIADFSQIALSRVASRMMGDWSPSEVFFKTLVSAEDATRDPSCPYPFYLASPLQGEIGSLGNPADWQAEWKWDGIRAQMIHREGQAHLWSRGEELITKRFPELEDAAKQLPDQTVLDGEILAYRDGQPLPFTVLQTRIARQKLTPKTLAECPVAFIAYDCLEFQDRDVRSEPLSRRRELLELALESRKAPLDDSTLKPSPLIEIADWSELGRLRESSRERGVEGLMLKRKSSPYLTGRKRGDWWKWKIEPYTMDAVLIYAQAGHGRRANLFTDYTFAVWKSSELVPVAKAYSGLTDEEINQLDRWIRAHTREKFGPVRSVDAEQVFEIAFEGIADSPRHRSGVAVRFPRILRWRRDKKPPDADSLERIRGLIRA